jgi:hypothetical protein
MCLIFAASAGAQMVLSAMTGIEMVQFYRVAKYATKTSAFVAVVLNSLLMAMARGDIYKQLYFKRRTYTIISTLFFVDPICILARST